MANITIDRLKAQLLTSGIQKSQPQLYQVINQLIDYLRSTASAVVSGSGTTVVSGGTTNVYPTTTIFQGLLPFGDSSEFYGEDYPYVIPGPPGPIGPIGPAGAAGSGGGAPAGLVPLIDSIGYEDEAPFIPGKAFQLFPQEGIWFEFPVTYSNPGAGGAWTVDAADVITQRAMRIGNTIWFNFALQNTTVSGGVAAELRMVMPVAIKFEALQCMYYLDNGVRGTGYCVALPVSPTVLRFSKPDASNWTVSTNATHLYGSVVMEIL